MNTIFILDFGSQYTYVLAKQVRKLFVYCEVLPWNISVQCLKERAPLGIILSGGPHSVYENKAPHLDPEIYKLGIPILAICYGMQLMARDFGGTVSPGVGEFGYTPIHLYPCELFKHIVDCESLDTEIRMSHRDHVTTIPEGFNVIASTSQCSISGIENTKQRLYGLQFHPEVSDSTPTGNKILETFVQEICSAPTLWNPLYIQQDLVSKIQDTVIEVFDEVAQSLDVQWLAQGTIYSDVIESSRSGHASEVIKSHHNVGGLPKNLKLKLVEPLRYLFKDEVRILGEALGLSSYLLDRHPFPGPGLTIRVIGEILPEYLAILRRADLIFIEELRKAKLYDKISQAFALFLPIKSVSVKGDCRSYGYTIALRAVESTDFMTGRWAYLPCDVLSSCSSRIINEIPEVSRVVYDISDKPPATIEWE